MKLSECVYHVKPCNVNFWFKYKCFGILLSNATAIYINVFNGRAVESEMGPR